MVPFVVSLPVVRLHRKVDCGSAITSMRGTTLDLHATHGVLMCVPILFWPLGKHLVWEQIALDSRPYHIDAGFSSFVPCGSEACERGMSNLGSRRGGNGFRMSFHRPAGNEHPCFQSAISQSLFEHRRYCACCEHATTNLIVCYLTSFPFHAERLIVPHLLPSPYFQPLDLSVVVHPDFQTIFSYKYSH